MGLAIARSLRQRGADVTILSQKFSDAAGHAAAGMLAPQAEGLAAGPMRDFCINSRDRYGDWAAKLEQEVGQSVGYWPSGILAPAYAAEDFPHPRSTWQDRSAILDIQPGLSERVTGGWWFPDDAQVDNRRLMQALRLAVQELGVELCESVRVKSWLNTGDRINHLITDNGDTWQAQHYILATGAWSQALLPIPVTPRKGQMMALRDPGWEPDHPFSGRLTLQTVLFGSHIYIVPRQDGRIIIGATSENVGFTAGNTAAGLKQLLQEAIRLVPQLAQAMVLETWWGYRPATPDELPILGPSDWTNLTLATGHYRNGVLLTPATAQAIADCVMSQIADIPPQDPALAALLPAFQHTRFGGNTEV